jgi:tetratricopeptide (TPR) repeat protein
MRTLFSAAVGAALFAGAAWAQTSAADEVLRKVRALSYEVREGRYAAAPAALALLEQALKSNPNDARLQTAYAVANFQMATASAQPGADPAKAVPYLFKGAAAFEKAVALDAGNADALAGRGAARTLMGTIQGKAEVFQAGVADMNRAVAIAPGAATPRLQRAFFGLNAPRAGRDDAVIETDLKQLIAWGTPREQDHLHLLLGDLYVETGKPELARAEYQAASRKGSTSAPLGADRLSALAAGKVDSTQIASLRSQLGSNCVMCHGK